MGELVLITDCARQEIPLYKQYKQQKSVKIWLHALVAQVVEPLQLIILVTSEPSCTDFYEV